MFRIGDGSITFPPIDLPGPPQSARFPTDMARPADAARTDAVSADALARAGEAGPSKTEALAIGIAFRQHLDRNEARIESPAPMPVTETVKRIELQSAGELALLNMDVYLDRSNPALLPRGYSALSDQAAERRFPGFQAKDRDSGFYARVYHDADRGDHVLVMRGTDDASAEMGIVSRTPDGRTNWSLALGERTSQARLAINNAEAIAGQTNGRLRLSGHSLGGALASLAAMRVQKPATIFNPLGIHPKHEANYAVKLVDLGRHVTAYTVKGDSVATVNSWMKLNTAPTVILASRSLATSATGYQFSGPSKDAHGIVSVLAGLLMRAR